MMYGLLINPVHALDARHFAKMLGVMCDNGQAKSTGCNTNDDVEIANSKSLAGKTMSNLCIVCYPVFYDGQHFERIFYLLWLPHVFLHIATVQRSVCEFCNAYLRGINVFWRYFRNMCANSATMVEVLNPSVGVKNVSYHNRLIIKIDLSDGHIVVTMFHHLIIRLSLFRLRPYPFQFKKTSLSLLWCKGVGLIISWHNQLVSQPLTIVLRERKSLQISPKII